MHCYIDEGRSPRGWREKKHVRHELFNRKVKVCNFFQLEYSIQLCLRLTSVEASLLLSAFQCFDLILLPPTPPAACLVLMQGDGELHSSDSELKAEGFP